MAETRSCKKFNLEILEGGKTQVLIDDVLVPNVSSFYISNDKEEQDLSIDLYQTDEQGFLNVISVMIGL